MGARKARQPTIVVEKKPAKPPVAKTASLAIHVTDPESRSLKGVHVSVKRGSRIAHEGFTDGNGEIECLGLCTGDDYQILVNNEVVDEVVGPNGDDEHEVEYDGDYTPNAPVDESEEDEDSKAEEDLDSASDDAEELDL